MVAIWNKDSMHSSIHIFVVSNRSINIKWFKLKFYILNYNSKIKKSLNHWISTEQQWYTKYVNMCINYQRCVEINHDLNAANQIETYSIMV